MGSLNGRVKRLEGLVPRTQEDAEGRQRTEELRAEIIAELEAIERRVRNMSVAEHQAWRQSDEYQAWARELEAEFERRRRGGA